MHAAVHLVLASWAELGPDEAHYALYGRKLDWCYVDHPPLVGWVQAVALSVSESELGLRLFAIAAFACVQLLLNQLCRNLFPNESPWIGLVSVLLLNSSIMFQGLSFMLIPESLLLVLGLLVATSLWRCAHFGRLQDWILLGVWMGLAGLAKFTAALLVLTAILYLVTEKRWNAWRTPGPWFAIMLASVLIAPVIAWNWEHRSISFSFRYHGIFQSSNWSFRNFVEGQERQLVYYGPAVWFGGIISLLLAVFGDWHSSGVRLLVLIALPIFVVCGEAAGFRVPLPHWTALGWLATLPLTARLFCSQWSRLATRFAAGIGAMYSVITITAVHLFAFYPVIRYEDYQYPEIVGNFHGWRESARIAADLRNTFNAARPGIDAPLFVHNWSVAAQLAWYARPAQVQVIDRQYDQFDMWFGTPATGAAGILVVPRYMDGRRTAPEMQSVLSRFERTRHVKEYSSKVPVGIVNTFDYYECEGFRGL